MADYQPALNRFSILVCVLALLAGCTDVSRDEDNPAVQSQGFHKQIIDWRLQRYQGALERALTLNQAVRSYLDNPAGQGLQELQQHWLTAHESWLEASFLDHGETDGQSLIDAWPIEPGYLDSLPAYPESGLVNDMTLTMNSSTVRQQHQYTDDREVALGFHVIEYYVFSRDVADLTGDNPANERRRLLLSLSAELLLLDMQSYQPTGLPASPAGTVARLHEMSQGLLSEFNRLGEHSRFSGSSLRNIDIRLRTMRDLLDQPPTLNHYLIDRNPEAARTFNGSLNKAIRLVTGRAELDEASTAHALLLVASISHQLEDFVE